MQALKLTNNYQHPFQTQNHNYPPLPYAGQSDSKDKLQFFKVQIRNSQIRDIKKRCRQELIISQHIEQLLNIQPANWRDSMEWSTDFISLYNEVKNMNLTQDQILSIFFLAQKFPNRLTLQLLQVVIIRASGQTLDILFQYDIMRLLHSPIIYDDAKGNSFPLNRSCSSEESEAIIKEAVIDKVSSAIARIDLKNELPSQLDILQMVRSSVSIIGELCKKSISARNFAIINHKTYTYCLKAYKKYNRQIQKEFFRFLRAATNIGFVRYQEQFNRISSKILNLVFTQNWKIRYVDDSIQCEDMLYCMKTLLYASRNLLAMNDSWTFQKIQGAETKYTNTLFGIAGNVIRDISGLLHQQKQIPVGLSGLLKAAIQLVMYYEDYLEIVTKKPETYSIYFSLKHQMSLMYHDLMYILHRSVPIPNIQELRKFIYFVLRNHLIDAQISESSRFSLLEIVCNNYRINLLHLLAQLLGIEFIPSIFFELAYFIYSVFQIVPITYLTAYLFESQLIQGVCGRIVDKFSSENKESTGKLILARSLLVLLQRMSRSEDTILRGMKSIIMYQYGNRLNNVITKNGCDEKLSECIEELLKQLQGEEWVQI